MRTYKTEGIIIKRINVGEADRILTVFTRKGGKISIKASGVRRTSSRRSPHIELLNYSSFTLHAGYALPIATEVESHKDFSGIKENLTKVGFAYHLCELIDGLCAENQEHPLIFDLFKSTLEQLEREEDIAPIIHEFEVDLLTKLGFYNRIETTKIDPTGFIEQILERKLKSRKLLSRIS